MAMTEEQKKRVSEEIAKLQQAGTRITKDALGKAVGVSYPTINKYLDEMKIELSQLNEKIKADGKTGNPQPQPEDNSLLTAESLKAFIREAKTAFTATENKEYPVPVKDKLAELLTTDFPFNQEISTPDKQAGVVKQWRNFLYGEDNLVIEKNVFPKKGKTDEVRFFGWIQEMGGLGKDNGQYKGLSYIVFPMEEASAETGKQLYAVTLNVGLADYGEDEYLARKPGTRRQWRQLLEDHSNLCTEYHFTKLGMKMNLEDRESKIIQDTQIIPKKYQESTLAFAVVDAKTIEGRLMMLSMLAQYAKMRGWTKKKHCDLIFEVLEAVATHKGNRKQVNDEEAVEALLKGRRFVVLQGAPGTGKTRLARKLAKKNGVKKPYFIQFHAETSYSDFVYGIHPDTAANSMAFHAKEGMLVKAIREAKESYDDAVKNKQTPKPVYLIIDEINRANLASVLGPTFYLFEPGLTYNSNPDDCETDVKVKFDIEPGEDELSLTALPPNLYVIATMNTADRSLAVVDFALRRRFAWYTMKPQFITLNDEDKKDKYFASKQFKKISDIFNEFATDEELNLKPGHAYFIVNREMIMAEWRETDGELPELQTDDLSELAKEKPQVDALIQRAVKTRLRYEVMPLIKEYLAEGMLSEAKNEFLSFFWHEIGESMIQ